MPIFFHVESHLWIAYLFLFNGLLLGYCLSATSQTFKSLIGTIEAQLVFAFSLSIGLNGIILLVCNWLNVSWSNIHIPFFALTLGLFAISLYFARQKRIVLVSEFSWWRLSFYIIAFTIMFYNGGLIEQISDAWWHMSLANKMSLASSFQLEQGHLTGSPDRYYPPLWHANLALAKLLSGESLPVIWNSFTAWGSVLKLMAYFIFGLALSRNTKVAFLGALLFFLLPGMGVSYMRVSAWPSHIAYILLFTAFYVTFRMFDELTGENVRCDSKLFKIWARQWVMIVILLFLLVQMLLIHQLEVVWYAIAIFVYLWALCILKRFSSDAIIENGERVLTAFFFIGCLLLCILCINLLHDKIMTLGVNIDRILAYTLPILAMLLTAMAFVARRRKCMLWALGLIIVLVALSVDITHTVSLFVPELALPMQSFRELPLLSKGHFGDWLSVPGWHLQLRTGLLYSGLLAVPLAIVLSFFNPTRANVFLASNALIALSFCISPYLYQWLQDVMNYHSSWRVAILIFGPLIWALSLLSLSGKVSKYDLSNRKRVGFLVILLVAMTILMIDSAHHFDKNTVALKKQHRSAQRHWSIFYTQEDVYFDSSLRYSSDMKSISSLVKPGAVVLSDISTSYYLAAETPAYVKNVHRHHSRSVSPSWRFMLNSKNACYLDIPEREVVFQQFVKTDREENVRNGTPQFQYVVVNKDQRNINMRNDCLSQRRRALSSNLNDFADLVFNGDFLMVYQIR